ncbi:MAG: VapC toxin family PIN domain ribonuclease [Gammaproteobacteria bacterium]|nr:MAG: VapC toxin family PIN domain ribonuclease [Gammaproteobacteria bacterium]
MILVDTSVWIDYFNGKDNLETDILDKALGNETVAIGDLILIEILQGFRADKQYNMAKELLEPLQKFEMLGLDIAVKTADNYRKLRKKGITIRKTADVIIATYCIENNIPLLFTDQDFIPFVKHLGLQPVALKI